MRNYPMTPEQAYSDLIAHMKEVAVMHSIGDVLYWDQEAYLPKNASDHRAEQLAQVSRLVHEWFTDPKVAESLSAIESSDMVADEESPAAVNVREWRRLYEREVRLPSEFVADFARATSRASQVWAEARRRSEFALFQPHLEEIVGLCRRKADYIGFETEAYDALLDGFEPYARCAEVEAVFSRLRPELVELVGKIKEAPRRPDIGILKRPYDVAKQRIFAESVAAAMGYDFEAGRFDESTHPSCNELGPGDTRVLTRYYPEDLAEGITSGMHEAGHALYDMTRPNKEHWGTPMGETDSLAIHESQSRMWENMVGRSRQFWVHFFPLLKRLFHDAMADVELDDFYHAMNRVAPSYIRVEADEATYNLHIMLRFELERAIIKGDIDVADIPGEWNRRFTDYLGLEVDNDANGCLQDVHWAHGIFGYFPTYALGNLYAGQFWAQAKRDVPGLLDDFARGEFGRLFGWLRDKIHSQGSRYYPARLCEQVTGEPLSHRHLLDYLYEKYAEIYGIR